MEPLYVEPLSCRCVRLGTCEVFPQSEVTDVTVYMTPDSIKFNAPNVKRYFPLREIVIRCDYSNRMIWYLGEKPALFIHPTDAFAEEVRFALDIDPTCPETFDPSCRDFKFMFVTFLINFLTEEQINFICNQYLPIETCTEITKKGCNELMVMTAPVMSAYMVRICSSDDEPSVVLGEATEGSAAVKPRIIASYRSKSRAGVLTVNTLDIMCVDNGNWLNDNIVNFYLEFMYSEYLTESGREKTHLFNSFFFNSITRVTLDDVNNSTPSMESKRHDLVKSWTRKVDLFSKDYIVIPVNNCFHWYLVIVCFPCNMTDFSNTQEISDMHSENMVTDQDGSQFSASMVENSASDCNSNGSQRQGMPCICVFDSIYNERRAAVTAEIVKDYLEAEHVRKKGVYLSFKPMRIYAMRCPQQPNVNDCGVYLLKNFESFFKNPFENEGDYIPNLEDWFYPACIFRKRQEIIRVIFDLQRKHTD